MPKSGMIVPILGKKTFASRSRRKSLADALLTKTQQRVLRVLFGQPWIGFEYRSQAGAIDRNELRKAARDLRKVVLTAARRVRDDAATGPTAAAKRLLLGALDARARALDTLIAGREAAYRRSWDRSVVLAREALTKLQDIRDRARLIPLPEDSIS